MSHVCVWRSSLSFSVCPHLCCWLFPFTSDLFSDTAENEPVQLLYLSVLYIRQNLQAALDPPARGGEVFLRCVNDSSNPDVGRKRQVSNRQQGSRMRRQLLD